MRKLRTDLLIVPAVALVVSCAALGQPVLYGGLGGHGAAGGSTDDGSLVIVNQTNGNTSVVGHPGGVARISGLAFGLNGVLFGTTQVPGGYPPPPGPPNATSNLIRIDPDTGSVISSVAITNAGTPISIADLTVQPGTGVLFGVRSANDPSGGPRHLYTINTTTGAATLIGDTGNGAGSIAFAPSGTLYMSSDTFFVAGRRWLTLDPATGAILNSVGTTTFFGALAVRPDGVIFGSTGDQHTLATIDPTSGTATLVGDTGTHFIGSLAFRSAAAAANFQGLWWAAGGTEAFWGINFAHSGDQVFGTWYTYDTAGKAYWLSMLAGRTTPNSNAYTGDINVDVGPPFNNFVGSGMPTKVGTGTLTFSDANNGTFHYDLNAGTGGSPAPVSQTKAIERYNLGTGAQPTCTFSPTANLALATNYQDLWWAASGTESGWGVNFAHQGDSVFLTWYTYDIGGAPLWLSALTQRQGATNVYTGALLRTSGPRFDNYKASDVVMPIPAVGTATLTFANGNSATFHYTTNGNGGLPAGVDQTKSIVRFPITAGGTACQ